MLDDIQKEKVKKLSDTLVGFFMKNADKFTPPPIQFQEFHSIVLSGFISAIGNILIITSRLCEDKELEVNIEQFVEKLFRSMPECDVEFGRNDVTMRKH